MHRLPARPEDNRAPTSAHRRAFVTGSFGRLAVGMAGGLPGWVWPAARASRTDELSAFEQVEVNLPCRLQVLPLVAGQRPRCTWQAEAAVLPALRAQVLGRQLVLGASSFQSRQGVSLTLHAAGLAQLAVQGAADVVLASGITAKDFTLQLAGSAQVQASGMNLARLGVDSPGAAVLQVEGRCQRQTVVLGGASHYQALELQSDEAQLDITGAASAELQVGRRFELKADGAATVRWRGSARLSQRSQGAATVEHLGG